MTIVLILLLLLAPQAPKPKTTKSTLPDDLMKRRDEYVKASEEYRQTLAKLLAIYESNVMKAEDKIVQSRKLLNEGLIGESQVNECEHLLEIEQAKVIDVKKQIATADEQIAHVLNDNEFANDYKQAVRRRRKEHRQPCRKWDLVYHRQSSGPESGGFKFVCR